MFIFLYFFIIVHIMLQILICFYNDFINKLGSKTKHSNILIGLSLFKWSSFIPELPWERYTGRSLPDKIYDNLIKSSIVHSRRLTLVIFVVHMIKKRDCSSFVFITGTTSITNVILFLRTILRILFSWTTKSNTITFDDCTAAYFSFYHYLNINNNRIAILEK